MQQYFIKGSPQSPLVVTDKDTAKHMFSVMRLKAGDKVTRGQQVAVLDAMKMHNVIGAPHDGTIAEVCVAAGQNVGHGDVIVTFAEG